MNKNTWIIERIKENDWDYHRVQEKKLYKRFIKETDSGCTYGSYKKRVNEVKNAYAIGSVAEKDYTDSEVEIDYSMYDEADLIKILEKEVSGSQKKITMVDLKKIAENNDIPYNAFLQNIVDLKSVLSHIYKMNLLHLGEEKVIAKLKDSIKVLRTELKHYQNAEVDSSLIIDALLPVIKTYERFSSPVMLKGSREDREGVLLLGDTHFDEKVYPEEIEDINEYNIAIAKKRLDLLFSSVTAIMDELSTKVLNIYFLGDMVSGMIHKELLIACELGIVETVMQLSNYIAQWIIRLSSQYRIKCLGVVGNHGRFSKKPHYKKKALSNFDYLLYKIINTQVKDHVEEFIIPKSAFKVTAILDYIFLTIHGDTFSGGNGMAPISAAVNRDIAKLAGNMRRYKKGADDIDYVNMGHFHTDTETKSFDGIKIILNGSLIGPNEFSINKIKRAERPSQTFYIVERHKGLRYKDIIYLD